jgi:hypothetical protein
MYIHKIVTISLTVYNLFTNIMSKSTFTKHKILENWILKNGKCQKNCIFFHFYHSLKMAFRNRLELII